MGSSAVHCISSTWFSQITTLEISFCTRISGVPDEIRTRDGWVKSANATSVLCRPPILNGVCVRLW